jgi:hypothetical protein
MLSRDHVRVRLSVTATNCDQNPSRNLILPGEIDPGELY